VKQLGKRRRKLAKCLQKVARLRMKRSLKQVVRQKKLSLCAAGQLGKRQQRVMKNQKLLRGRLLPPSKQGVGHRTTP
jgi:hypothetical protein